MPSIESTPLTLDVSAAVDQIEAHPEYWDKYTMRTSADSSPHSGLSDIWVRYNAWKNYKGDQAAFASEHESVWYPCWDVLTELHPIVESVCDFAKSERLGGVLITRIQPGGAVRPHIDTGWHAGYYSKYAVQLKGNKEQMFGFQGIELRPMPGEVYKFDNSKLHWVNNPSREERMTLIICIKEKQ